MMEVQATACDIRDRALAGAGAELIERAAGALPCLLRVRERFAAGRPLLGLRIAACLPVTPETANLVLTLSAAGADVALCGASPSSIDDAVAAALVEVHDVRTYAIEGEDAGTHRVHVAAALAHRPDLTMDAGAGLVAMLHRNGGRAVDRVVGGTEAAAAGAARLEAMARAGTLRYPIIAVEGAAADASLAAQALGAAHLARHGGRMRPAVHGLPAEIDRDLGRLSSEEGT